MGGKGRLRFKSKFVETRNQNLFRGDVSWARRGKMRMRRRRRRRRNFPFSLPLLSASSFCTPTLSPAAIEQKLSRAKVLDVVHAPRRPTYEVSEELCHFPFSSSTAAQGDEFRIVWEKEMLQSTKRSPISPQFQLFLSTTLRVREIRGRGRCACPLSQEFSLAEMVP